jgi:predicted metal-dependent hydrolase
MAKKTIPNVTMRVRVGDSELEVSGPQNFVEAQIEAFLEKQKKAVKGGSGKSLTQQTPIGTLTSGKKLSVAQFFRKLTAQTEVDRTLAAGYYLERYENFESFTALEVREKIRQAKINPPKNTNNTIDLNIKKGLIMPAGDKDGRRAFVLTSDGEDAINEMLKE